MVGPGRVDGARGVGVAVGGLGEEGQEEADGGALGEADDASERTALAPGVAECREGGLPSLEGSAAAAAPVAAPPRAHRELVPGSAGELERRVQEHDLRLGDALAELTEVRGEAGGEHLAVLAARGGEGRRPVSRPREWAPRGNPKREGSTRAGGGIGRGGVCGAPVAVEGEYPHDEREGFEPGVARDAAPRAPDIAS